ncbi:MAG TPA: FGGY family carbohydrate kinase [Anaerolineales bacterium]|nr:FGGY family carbohydrate kinase [Anaerolineales bacterium]
MTLEGPLLGIDVGTTHCKAGLFRLDGDPISVSSRPTPLRRSPEGNAFYDPQELWATVAAAIREVVAGCGRAGTISAIGIASMAETGLLVDRKSGAPRSPLIPWFDPAATPQAELLKREGDHGERFLRSGIRPNFKCSLAKVLWLREQDKGVIREATWLSTADYIAYCLTGVMATDYSLAGRTYAFRIDQKTWDEAWLGHLGLDVRVFPTPLPSGTIVGWIEPEIAAAIGLPTGTPVSIAGHDHVCAAFAAGAIDPGLVFDSMGTAEALIGGFEERSLEENELRSGLVYGCHVVKGRNYWMGGLSASGGSVEWLGAILDEPPLSYAELDALLEGASPEPTGILYFPYLSGSGSPHTDFLVRGAFTGLNAAHGQSDLAKAVLEGTAYEVEFIRRAAEMATGSAIHQIIASGGGTRNRHWMQIKADVSGCRLEVLPMPEATLLGAALVAGVGCGVFADAAQAIDAARQVVVEIYLPDAGRHQGYIDLYERGYLHLQAPLRQLAREIEKLPCEDR